MIAVSLEWTAEYDGRCSIQSDEDLTGCLCVLKRRARIDESGLVL